MTRRRGATLSAACEARRAAESEAMKIAALKKAQEEERIRKEREQEEMRRRKQEEEEVRRAAEERKKKMEADRRRQLEEQALRAEEERRKLEEERRKQEEEQIKLAEDLKSNEPIMQVAASHHAQPTYDLLGGSLDVEPDVDTQAQEVEHYQDDVYSNYSDMSNVSRPLPHRDLPERGPIDENVDSLLDYVNTTVPIKKTTKNRWCIFIWYKNLESKIPSRLLCTSSGCGNNSHASQ